MPLPQQQFMIRILHAARLDDRILAVVDYGSSSEGRNDRWSDVDIGLFVRNCDYDEFMATWRSWAEQFGDLLMGYVSWVGHPWAVYAAEPVPFRVDFDFLKESSIDRLIEWPNSPLSVENFVLYDGSDGKVTSLTRHLVGKSLKPLSLEATFDQVSGDFWYYLLRVWGKLQRDDIWTARLEYHQFVFCNLIALMRIEAGEDEPWHSGASLAIGIGDMLPAARLMQLRGCLPSIDDCTLHHSLRSATLAGGEVCESIASNHNWPWPKELSSRLTLLFEAQAG